MKKYFIIDQKKLVVLLTITAFCLSNKIVFANEACNNEQLNITSCYNKVANLDTLNNQFNKTFSSGGVINISQPPMVLLPKIEINGPTQLNANKEITLRPKTINRMKKKPKQVLDEGYFKKIFEALDITGQKQLNQCVSRISENKIKSIYPMFLNEMKTLKEITLRNSAKSNRVGSLFSNKPSQRKCIEYLDFIFMIS